MSSFKEDVYAIVAKIPRGKVVSYGQLAAACGKPRAARIVGGMAHFGPDTLPWHRVVMQNGSLARGYPGGMPSQAKHLEQEGVTIKDLKIVNVEEYRWQII